MLSIGRQSKPVTLNFTNGAKPKDLVGIPWRIAFALQQPYYTGKIKENQTECGLQR